MRKSEGDRRAFGVLGLVEEQGLRSRQGGDFLGNVFEIVQSILT